MPIGTFVPEPSVVALEVLDEVVLVDVATGACCALDPAGARLWRLVLSSSSEDDAVRRAAEGDPGDRRAVRADLRRFITELEQKRFLRSVPPEPDGPGPEAPGAGR
jgi:Coenzyme PQQ synthesis protein D (PqqD)